MENNPRPDTLKNDIKQVLLFIGVVAGVFCFLVLCTTGALYGGVGILNKRQEQAQAAHATRVAAYDIFDDFEDNDNVWEVGDESNEYWQGSVNIQDGTYVWTIDEYTSSDGSFYDYRDSDRNMTLYDFDLSVDGKLATPQADVCYGVNFRDWSPGGYLFTVCNDRTFAVKYNSYEDNQEDEMLQYRTFSRVIHSDDWNTLGVSARGDHFVLSINGSVVFEFTDARLPSGEIYLLLDSNDTIPGTILFDNFGLQPRW